MFGKKKQLTEKEIIQQEQELERQQALWKREKNILEGQKQIKEEKETLIGKKKRMSTSKWICLFLLINFTLIEIFTGWVTLQTIILAMTFGSYADFSPLVAFIGAFIGEVTTYAVYASKAKAENTKGGIVYDQAMSVVDSSQAAG